MYVNMLYQYLLCILTLVFCCALLDQHGVHCGRACGNFVKTSCLFFVYILHDYVEQNGTTKVTQSKLP